MKKLFVLVIAFLPNLGCNRDRPRVELAQPANSPKKAEQKKPQELIVGKWEGEKDGVPSGAEFTDKGQVIFLGRMVVGKGDEKRIGGPLTFGGTYKFLDDKTVETELAFGKAVQTQYHIEITSESLKMTGEKKTMAFKRVQEFSTALTKATPKINDKEASASKAATAEAVLTFKKHEASVESVAVSPDGTLIASGGDDGVLFIWERATGKVRHKLGTHEDRKRFAGSESVRSVTFSPDGSTLASGSSGGGQLWNVETGERRRGSFGGGHVAFSPDGKTLVTATFDEVHVWDLQEDMKVFSKKTPGSISSVAVSHDGKLIASGDYSNYVRVWDAKTGEQTFSYKDSRAQVHSVAFSADGTLLAVDSGRIYLTLFDMANREKVPFKGSLATTRFSRPLFLPDKRARTAPCSYLPYSAVFTPCTDSDENSFGFELVNAMYLAVRGTEVVGIIGEANGQIISIGGMQYDEFMEEYSVIPTCSCCGEPVVPDEDSQEDDDGPFDPADFR